MGDEVPCPVCRLGLSKTGEALGKVIVCPDCMTHLLVRRRDTLAVVSKKVMPDPELSAKRAFEHYAGNLKYGELYVVSLLGLVLLCLAGVVLLIHFVFTG